MPHQHPTWAAAACVLGATYDRLWLRTSSGDVLEPLPEVQVLPGTAFTMMPHDIHSVRGHPDGPSLHLLMYGRVFDRAVVFDPDTWRAYEHLVPAIAA
jgi:predicted metal-dependent enzyme (double-stranded beta helix superfamily)